MRPELPTRRQEAWRWADLRHAEALATVPAPANDGLPDLDRYRIARADREVVLSGGHPVSGESAGPAVDGKAPAHPLADFAAAVARAGLDLAVARDSDGGTVGFLHLGTEGAAHSASRIILEPGARLTLLETLSGTGHDHWLNHRIDVTVGEGAAFTRVLLVPNAEGLVSERLFARVGRAARLVAVTLAVSRAALRTEVSVALEGKGAEARADAALLGEGGAALDAATRIVHEVPQTASTQTFRLVAAGQAQVSIAGGVTVARHAQKSDAAQSLRALVLARTAAANLKPELEILADDVTCAHGCAVGELDRAALFYLMSRGLARPAARALLAEAFLGEVFAALPEALSEPLARRARAFLERAA
ncbi:SufD family Fe-S cluster assembly protein [Thermaurantiacus sp.]